MDLFSKLHAWTGSILCAMMLISSARGQTVSLSVKAEPIEKVFLLIEKQTGYIFIYSTEAIALSRPVTLNVKDETLPHVLSLCFKNQPLNYTTMDNKHIIVKLKIEEKPVSPDRELKGKVVNENGEAVAGVTIAIKNSQSVTISDNSGHFGFNRAPDHAILLVSGAEMQSQEVSVGNQDFILIHAQPKLGVLDETIIKGYYKTSRKFNTGTVGKVTAKDIATQPVSNPLAALQGRVSGLFITQSSGLPGSQFSVLIRGRNSIQNGNEPLYIVDGVIFSPDKLTLRSNVNVNSPFNTLVPDDIESIEVLKDADATSLYGSRGANGVILITTKKGKEGKPQLEVSLSTGWGRVARTMDYMNTRQYLEMRREAYTNDGMIPSAADAGDLLSFDTTRYTDWKKQLIGGTANLTNSQVRYSGGSMNTTFSVSSNYYRETTVFPGNFSDQHFSFASALTNRSNDNKFNFSLSGNYSQEVNKLVNQDLSGFLKLPPNGPALHDADGKLTWNENGWWFDNPLAPAYRPYRAEIDRLTASSSISYSPLRGLIFRTNGGMNRQHLNEKNQTPIASLDPTYNPKGSASFGSNDLQSWIVEVQGEYNYRFRNLLRLKTMFGSSWQHSRTEGNVQDGTGYTSDVLLNTINGAASVSITDHYSKYRYHALFARIEMNYRDKWIVNLTGRRDGSSRFGPGNRYANFGAAGLAWIFTSEPFLSGNKFLSFGKIRMSYGLAGNDQIGNYQYFDTYTTTLYPFLGQAGLRPLRLFNPDYGWEQKANVDLALETGLFNNRILLNAVFFRSTIGNQIIQYTLPSQTGSTGITRNFPGLVENKGWEFEVSSKNITGSKFSWNSSFNLTIPRNKLLRFPGLENSSYASSYKIGEPLNLRFLYEYTGIDPQTGVYTFTDVNRDGFINSLDRTQTRHTNPKFYGGLQNNLTFGKLEASLFLQFVKQDGIEPMFASFSAPGFSSNQPVYLADRWQKPGDNARYQRYTVTTGPAYFAAFRAPNSTAIITDASFIRVKNISIAYILPASRLKFMGINTARLFVHAQNLFTITSYRGPDPENQSVTAIPPLRVITIGGRLTF